MRGNNSSRAIIFAFLTGTSAAQKAPVIRICSKCGALLMDEAEPCSFCEDSSENPDNLQPVACDTADEEPEPEWRREVNRRLAQYRARRGGVRVDQRVPSAPDVYVGVPIRHPKSALRETPSRSSTEHPVLATNQAQIAVSAEQTGLPFREKIKRVSEETEALERPRPRTLARVRPNDRMEICIQPELDFSAAAGERGHPQTALVPVASLSERRNAGVVDALFILLTCAAFAGLFAGLLRSMSAQVVLDRMDAVICAPVLLLFYSLYFLVFTVFAGATPGMQFCGLTVVRLDGHLPDTRQLLWRGFGYVLSGATLMLGFLWAFWDEDSFTWQDRISQTYVTASNPLADPDPIEVQSMRRGSAR
jgi:uncharacterized RDD family membrane protein YckC